MNGLDAFLPAHLRQAPDQSSTQQSIDGTPSAVATARYMLAQAELYNETILYDLAVDQGRWRAAVWLVEHLVAHFHAKSPRSRRSAALIQQWTLDASLDDSTENPISLVEKHERYSAEPHLQSFQGQGLDELTGEEPEDLSKDERLRYDILGMVWFTLGRMISVSATAKQTSNDTLRPEVLEMIALLHHHELMPESIYSYLPVESKDAIQQPPTLHLLSSRIMTALSDATWRARELSALEAAQKRGSRGSHNAGPEIPGSSYRVRVTTVKPEVWLELMLWSCLHGGWIKEGIMLLARLAREKDEKQWKPISWRESLRAVMPFGDSGLLDWENIKFMYDTRSSGSMDHVDTSHLSVERTISSEVVDAYIDALLSVVDLGVGHRGASSNFVTSSLRTLRSFLQRANLNLGGGSWDALVLRLADTVGIRSDNGVGWITQLSNLSPRFGEELHARHVRDLPPYIHDGSAAILGLLHRALRDGIRQGNFEMALKVFRLIQERVDDDKNRAIHDFFESKRSSTDFGTVPAERELFTSNFSGIEYPALQTQIPAGVLAAFLELVIDNRAYDFATWMLFSKDIDGPIIPERLYCDPTIASALIRFAISTDDLPFLTTVINKCSNVEGGGTAPVPKSVLQAFLDAQIELRRWSAVDRILVYMKDTTDFYWSLGNLANMLRSVILLSNSPGADANNAESDLWRAEALAARMLSENIAANHSSMQGSTLLSSITSLTVVISAVSEKWATFCRDNKRFPRYFYYILPTQIFNRVLEAVLKTQGSFAGRTLVEKFLVEAQHHVDEDKHYDELQGMERMPRFRDDALRHGMPQRSVVSLPGSGVGKIAMYGSLKPNQATVNMIYEQTLRELEEKRRDREPSSVSSAQDATEAPANLQDAGEEALETLAWVMGIHHRLLISQKHIWDRVATLLTAQDLERLNLKARERRGISSGPRRDLFEYDTVLEENEDGGWDPLREQAYVPLG